MDISNIQGANAYTANKMAGENTQVQNLETTRANLDRDAVPTSGQESQQTAQKAFEVTITQEARDQLAAETQEASQVDQARQTQTLEAAQTAPPAQEPPSKIDSGQAARQAPSQIVNIVA